MLRVPTDEHLNRLMPNGVPRYIRCYDNGGETFDRYTVVFTKKRNAPIQEGGEFIHLGMSQRPYHPQGFGQHGTSFNHIDGPGHQLGKRIKFEDLPAECQMLVIADYKSIWDLNPKTV